VGTWGGRPQQREHLNDTMPNAITVASELRLSKAYLNGNHA